MAAAAEDTRLSPAEGNQPAPESCPICDGTQRISCPKCDGGGGRCRRCEGKGEAACVSCEGKGRTACARCTGEPRRTCASCDGKGKLFVARKKVYSKKDKGGLSGVIPASVPSGWPVR